MPSSSGRRSNGVQAKPSGREVSIPSSSGPRSNQADMPTDRWFSVYVSIPSSSGPPSNCSSVRGMAPRASQSLLRQVRVLTAGSWALSSRPRSQSLLRQVRVLTSGQTGRVQPLSQSLLRQVRVLTEGSRNDGHQREVSIPSSSGPRSNFMEGNMEEEPMSLNPFFVRSAF